MALIRPNRRVVPLLSFTAIDFETTGFNVVKDGIIEVGAVKVRDNEIIGTINFMVKPLNFDGNLKAEVTKVTGHTSEDVMKGLDEETAIHILMQFIAKDTVVTHNAIFDLGMLENSMQRLGYDAPYFPVYNDCLCTLTIGREHYPFPHKLGNMCNRFNIPLDPHGALNDAMATAQLLIAMNNEHDVMKYVNVLGYKKQYGEPEYVPVGRKLKAQGNVTVYHGSGAFEPSEGAGK